MDPIKMAAAFVLGLGVSGAGYGLLARAAADPAPPPKPAAIVAADAPPAPAPTPPKAADPPASGDEAKEARRRVFAMGGPTQAWAYDAKNRKWRVYKAPDSSSLTVSSGKSIATAHSHAFMGSKFTELAAFSADTGEWSRQALIEPYDGSMILASIAIDDDHAYYNVGEFLYVFTSRDGRWHHARLTAKPEDGPRTDFGMPENLKVGGKCVMYLDKVRRRLSAFSIATETWDFLDLDRVSPQGDVRTSPDGLVYVMNGDRLFAYEPKLGKFREVRPDEG